MERGTSNTPPSIMDTCPTCGVPVRIIRREDGAADHYEGLTERERNLLPNPPSPILVDYLRVMRKGKKTVAIVGGDWRTGPWAPFGMTEVWCVGAMHLRPWVGEVTRWFEIHGKGFRPDYEGHRKWLGEQHDFPIYTDKVYDDIPASVRYPLFEIQDKLLNNIVRGELKMKKLFSSTISYEVALAIYEGFERIELFGVNLAGDDEWAYQREGLAYWTGKADGLGIEVWMPEISNMLNMPLYAYEMNYRGGKPI